MPDLDDIRVLLSGIPGEYGAGDMYAWADSGDADAMPQLVHDRMSGTDLLGGDVRRPDDPPKTAAWLASRLREVDEAGAGKRFVRMTTRAILLNQAGPYREPEAREKFAALCGLLGPGTRWWSNATEDTNSWQPVTSSVKDAILIAAGSSVVVTVLGDDND
jgi:hypothetical protein